MHIISDIYTCVTYNHLFICCFFHQHDRVCTSVVHICVHMHIQLFIYRYIHILKCIYIYTVYTYNIPLSVSSRIPCMKIPWSCQGFSLQRLTGNPRLLEGAFISVRGHEDHLQALRLEVLAVTETLGRWKNSKNSPNPVMVYPLWDYYHVI